jgi:hypothetical protein
MIQREQQFPKSFMLIRCQRRRQTVVCAILSIWCS